MCRLSSEVKELLFPSVRHYEHKTSQDINRKRKQIFNSTDYTYINCSAKIWNQVPILWVAVNI